jgi:hypothetical protein
MPTSALDPVDLICGFSRSVNPDLWYPRRELSFGALLDQAVYQREHLFARAGENEC